MADEEGKRAREIGDHPNLAHMLVLTMEEFSDKLKLLGYEKGFCAQLRFKPMSRLFWNMLCICSIDVIYYVDQIFMYVH